MQVVSNMGTNAKIPDSITLPIETIPQFIQNNKVAALRLVQHDN